MNSSAIAFREPPRGRPFGGGGVYRNGGLGALAPINLFTGIQVTRTVQRRAKKKGFLQCIVLQPDLCFETVIAIMIEIDPKSGSIAIENKYTSIAIRFDHRTGSRFVR